MGKQVGEEGLNSNRFEQCNRIEHYNNSIVIPTRIVYE